MTDGQKLIKALKDVAEQQRKDVYKFGTDTKLDRIYSVIKALILTIVALLCMYTFLM